MTGESSTELKYSLPTTKEIFSYTKNSKSILLRGTIIKDCESLLDKNTIRALVINTSYNSFFGNMVQYMLDNSSSNFRFNRQLFKLYSFNFLLFLGLGIGFYTMIDREEDYGLCPVEKYAECNEYYRSGILRKIINCITTMIPPILPIASSFSFFINHHILNLNKISCFSPSRLYAASNCNKLILDKTGTLTEDEIELSGFLPTIIKKDNENSNLNEVVFYKEEVSLKDLNYLHKNFWKKFCKNIHFEDYYNSNSVEDDLENEERKIKFDLFQEKYKQEILENPKNSYIYFTECLGTCHSIDKIKNIFYGNSLDKKIFNIMNWIFIPKLRIGNFIRKSVNKNEKGKFTFNKSENEADKDSNNFFSKEKFREQSMSPNKYNKENISSDSNYEKNLYKIDEKYINKIFKRRNNLIRKDIPLKDYILYVIIPKHSHKITQNLKINDRKNIFYNKTYKLGVLKRFEFNSSLQSISVIVMNNFDGSIRYYIKGAPETILSKCNKKSVPIDYFERLFSLTKVMFLI